MLLGIRDGSSEQPDREPLAAEGLFDEKAHHRPDRLIIDLLQDSRAFQNWVVYSWSDGTPPNRVTTAIGQKTWNLTGLDDLSETVLIPLTLLPLELRPRQPPPHTPTAAARSTWSEQCFKILPSLSTDWMILDIR
jgi:hypothetical protein